MQLDDFKIPEGVSPKLAALAWLIGNWEGTGHCQIGDKEPFEFEQRIEFSHNGGAFLCYVSQCFKLEDAKPVAALGVESGFWFPQEDANVDIVLSNDEARCEVWTGKIQMSRIELHTDAVLRTVNAQVNYSGGTRLYGFVEGDLMYAHDRALEDDSLRPYMWARLKRV